MDITDISERIKEKRQVVRDGVANKDFLQIETAMLQIIALEPAVPDHWTSLVDYAITFDKMDRAAAHFHNMNRGNLDEGVNELGLRKARIRIGLRLGYVVAAADEAENCPDNFDGDIKSAQYAMRAFARSGRYDAFIRTAKILRDLSEGDEPILAEICHLQNNLGYSAMVVDYFNGCDPDSFSCPSVLFEWGKAVLAVKYIAPEGCAALERALLLDKDHPRIRQILAIAYKRLSRHTDALALLDSIAGDATDSTKSTRAEVLMEMGRYNDAVVLYEGLVAQHPGHRGWRRALVGSYMLAGKTEQAKAAYTQDISNRQIPSSTSFQSSLEDIELDFSTVEIPAYRFEWAYQRLAHMGHAPADRAQWENDCKWVNLADLVTLNWLETRTSAVEEIYTHFEGADAFFEEIRFHVEKGFGCFLATAHVGALFAGPLALASSGLDYRWIASTPVVESVPGSENLFSTYSQNRFQLARASYRAIRSGAVVCLAIDGAIASTSRQIAFAGDQILVSDFVPRAIYQTGAPSFFPMTAWENRKVVFELVQLPVPEPTQTLDEFVNIWLTAFGHALEDFFVRFPSNPRLSGGFWGYVRL